MAHQVKQEIERSRLDCNRVAGAAQFAAPNIEHMVAEGEGQRDPLPSAWYVPLEINQIVVRKKHPLRQVFPRAARHSLSIDGRHPAAAGTERREAMTKTLTLAAIAAVTFAGIAATPPAHANLSLNGRNLNSLTFNGTAAQGSAITGRGLQVIAIELPATR
jgi:hypothetical protein